MNVLAAIVLFKLVDIFASIISSPEISNTSTSFKNNPSELSVLIKISNKFPKHFLHPITEESSIASRIRLLCHFNLSKLFFVKYESSNNLK